MFFGWGIGTQIESNRELTESELGLISGHKRYLAWFDADSALLSHVVEEFVALEALFSSVRGELHNSRGHTIDNSNGRRIVATAQRHVLNYLSLMRTFVDHTTRRMKDRFGNRSPEHSNFEAGCKHHFDNTHAYRFLYRLRNFAQHKELPIGNFEFSATVGLKERDVVSQFELAFSRDKLIEVDPAAWRGVLLDEMKAGPECISVVDTLRLGLNVLTDLHLLAIYQYANDMQSACDYLESFASVAPADAEPLLMTVHSVAPAKVSIQQFMDTELIAKVRETLRAMS